MAMNQQDAAPGVVPGAIPGVVPEVTGVPTEVDALAAVAGLLHALSDPNRLAILEHLALGEHRVVDLTAHLGLAQSTVSKHLACLRDCGLVVSRPSGRASMISLAQPELTHAVLAATVRLLDVTSGPCGAA